MKKFLYALCLLAMLTPAAFAAYNRWFARRTVVILSTNDIHAAIAEFPRLASAVQQCRDTVACILVDAGDRWTGDAFVDLAPEPRKPIVDLMNDLGFEVATFGNHEFDSGRDFLREMMKNYAFTVVCTNIRSTDGEFPAVAPWIVKRVGGLDIGFAGVVTNFQYGHPEGHDRSFVGLEFPDAIASAVEAVNRMKPRCDVSVLISHMGYTADTTMLNNNPDLCDLLVSGHSHYLVDTVINNTIMGQTEKALRKLGVTTIHARGHKVTDISYRNVDLKNYPPDPLFQSKVDDIYAASDYLNQKVGYNTAALDKIGLADMHTTIVREATGADIAFYHYGGIRLSELAADSVSRGQLINSDIFYSSVYTMSMTPAQMRKMIVTKYNDKGNKNESHRIDLFSTAPYTLVTDSRGEAVDVLFPTLAEGRKYRVAICNYVYETYKGIEAESVVHHPDMKVPDLFIEYFSTHSPVTFSNTPRQTIATVQ